MMKTTESPRSLYRRNGVIHTCFGGKYYGPTGESLVKLDLPVTCSKLESDGGRARVEVTQRQPGRANVVETWRSVNVPRGKRRGA